MAVQFSGISYVITEKSIDLKKAYYTFTTCVCTPNSNTFLNIYLIIYKIIIPKSALKLN